MNWHNVCMFITPVLSALLCGASAWGACKVRLKILEDKITYLCNKLDRHLELHAKKEL